MVVTLSQIKDAIGMDANYFYPLLVTIAVTIIPLMINFFRYINNTRINNILDLHKKEESDFFYFTVLLIEVLCFFIGFIMSLFLSTIIYVITNISMIVKYILFFILSIFLGFVSVKFMLIKSTFVRKRVLGEDNWRWLIYAPIILYNLFLIYIFFPECNVVAIIANILLGVVEIIGLLRFQGRYIKYEYSSLNIYTNSGDKIECENISKIKRKGDILIVEVKNGKIHVNNKNISKIEYKGNELIILKNLYKRR